MTGKLARVLAKGGGGSGGRWEGCPREVNLQLRPKG